MRAASRPLLPALSLLAGVGVALVARVVVAGSAGPAQSVPAALVFSVLLFGVAAAKFLSSQAPLPHVAVEGAQRGTGVRGRSRVVALGAAGGGVLVLLVVLLPGLPVQLWPRPSAAAAVPWTLLVACIAVAEEVVFRGVLFDAVARLGGAVCAAVVCALAFAAVHVPLYGWRALPLDLGVGLWLGGLRVLSGGVIAPAVAHAVADCGAWLVL
ncbi:MAG TPA: CPBP family intramembrane glutamic endopeptidase [Candidatus Angelobacter sp.]|nr:CPBP family intramembrane glutamic endopeptidase [Candidatus Angelobacter sp.]